MNYMDFHCSFSDYNKELNRFLFKWTFIAVLVVVVKNHIDFYLCQLWIMLTIYVKNELCGLFITFSKNLVYNQIVLALIVKNYVDFCLYQLLIMWTFIAVFGVVVKTYIGFYLC